MFTGNTDSRLPIRGILIVRYKATVLTLLIVLTIGALPHTATAAQVIDWLRADPAKIQAGTPTTVSVTAQVGTDPTLLPQSVMLLRYDENGQFIVNLGRLYDDGTHDDALAGDGIFTAKLNLNEVTPQTILLRASVAYRGLLRRVISEPFRVIVQTTVTPEQVLQIISNKLRAGDIEAALSHFGGSEIDRTVLKGLTDEGRRQLANAFSSAQLVEDTNGVRVYTAPWVHEGQQLNLEFMMMRNNLGEWIVASW